MGALSKTKSQHGFALFMTLVTLVIITISGIAMMRVMEAGVSAAGNIAFRQAAARIAGVAGEAALTRIKSMDKATLAVTSGDYYANTGTLFDPVTYNWSGNSTALPSNALPDKLSGYDVNYVIHRMAVADGLCEDLTATGCTFSSAASSVGTAAGASQSGGSQYGAGISNVGGLVYYRVTVKVSGPKHNISYVQTLMY
jgi:type IV pilus assembly protein PilX